MRLALVLLLRALAGLVRAAAAGRRCVAGGAADHAVCDRAVVGLGGLLVGVQRAGYGFFFHHDDHPHADFFVGAHQRRAVDPACLALLVRVALLVPASVRVVRRRRWATAMVAVRSRLGSRSRGAAVGATVVGAEWVVGEGRGGAVEAGGGGVLGGEPLDLGGDADARAQRAGDAVADVGGAADAVEEFGLQEPGDAEGRGCEGYAQGGVGAD